jgi:hypothetical protein
LSPSARPETNAVIVRAAPSLVNCDVMSTPFSVTVTRLNGTLRGARTRTSASPPATMSGRPDSTSIENSFGACASAAGAHSSTPVVTTAAEIMARTTARAPVERTMPIASSSLMSGCVTAPGGELFRGWEPAYFLRTLQGSALPFVA